MSRPDLSALGAELQAELRLMDWVVVYVYVPDLCDAAGNAVYGLCDRLVDNKTATIAIRDPLASQPLPEGAEDKPVESVLMHELVHLHMAPLAVNTPQGITAEEQAVWPIAEALTRWRGTARGEMVARAMRAGPQTIQKKEIRKMGAAAKALAMLKAAMESDGVKEDSAASRCLAALMADDEKPPESEKGEEKPAPARAAETEPEKREPPAARPAAAAMTIAEVDQRAATVASRMIGEHAERSALIASNAGVLGAHTAALLANQPLAAVKLAVMAANLDATARGSQPAAGQRAARAGGVGPLGPLPSDPLAGVPAADREETARAVQRVARVFGLETDKRPAITIDSRGMSLSNVGSIQEQHADLVRAGQIAAQQGRA